MKYLKYNHDKFMLLLFWRYFFSDAYYTPGFTTVQAHIYLMKKNYTLLDTFKSCLYF